MNNYFFNQVAERLGAVDISKLDKEKYEKDYTLIRAESLADLERLDEIEGIGVFN